MADSNISKKKSILVSSFQCTYNCEEFTFNKNSNLRIGLKMKMESVPKSSVIITKNYSNRL